MEKSKQKLADLIICYEQIVKIARMLYPDPDFEDWAIQKSLSAQKEMDDTKKKLMDVFKIDFDSDLAKTQIIKQGSNVVVLVNHMDGMKGSKAVVKSYSIPAMASDIIMGDGMKMPNHKWLTNDEVKLL